MPFCLEDRQDLRREAVEHEVETRRADERMDERGYGDVRGVNQGFGVAQGAGV